MKLFKKSKTIEKTRVRKDNLDKITARDRLFLAEFKSIFPNSPNYYRQISVFVVHLQINTANGIKIKIEIKNAKI